MLLKIQVVKMVATQDWSDMDEGWLYGEWETGPWWAFHTKVLAFIGLVTSYLLFLFKSLLEKASTLGC